MDFIGGLGNAFSRKVFSLDRQVRRAKLTVTADPHSYAYQSWMVQPGGDPNWLLAGSFLKFRVYLGGELAALGPARAIKTGCAVVSHFDVTALLHPGRNVIGVISRGERYGVALRLSIEYLDDTRLEIVSGADWKTLPGNDVFCPICWRKPSIAYAAKGHFGPGEQPEHIEGERWPFGWLEPGFDDSTWLPATVTAPDGALEPDGEEPPEYVVTRIAPVSVEALPDGRFVVDFGRAVFGGIELARRVAGLVELRLGEELLPWGGVRFQMRTGNCYQEGWNYPEGGGVLSHFGLRSFRYAELVGAPGLVASDIAALAVGMPFNGSESEFHCSDERLERVWKLCRNSVEYATPDVYFDCPSRERMAYEADAYINMLTHFAVESHTETARRTILYQMNHYTWPCEWRMFMIPVVYEYFMHTGDLALLRQVYDRLVVECSYHPLMRDGLVMEFPLRVIVDWPASCRDGHEFGPGDAVPNAFLHRDLTDLAQLAGYLGRTADAAEFARLARENREAFRARLFDQQRGLFRDNMTSEHCGFHANVFALAFGLADDATCGRAVEFIDRAGMRCSVYGAQFYLDALFRYGRAERAVELMTAHDDRSWLRMIDFGATTSTEAWNPELKPNMSFVHPWGSAPGNVIQRRLFGLLPEKPGWEAFRFEPQPGGLQRGCYRFKTPRGIIEARFDCSSGRLEKEVTVH